MEIGILTFFTSPGSYSIFETIGGIHLNSHPKDTLIIYGFTDQNNAEGYAKAFYRNALYPIMLTKVIGLIKK